jgi:chromosome partitioning protein
MRIIAIVNQKGGCGKTTTAVNLAGCLATAGDRVLLVDLDPQAHATLALGFDPELLSENLYEILVEPIGTKGASRLADVVQPWSDRLHLAPSGIVLSALEQKLTADRAEQRTERLAAALAPVAERYDWCLIDCPPNVGVLTFNALRAAREVIVPLETSDFALHGVQKLLETIALLTERVGHALGVHILPTLYDGRTRYARDTLADIRERFGDLCFDTVIRSNIKLREAVRRGEPIVAFARSANGAQDYGSLAIELSLTPPPDHRAPAPDHRAPPPEHSAPRAAATAPAAGEREVVVRYRDPSASDVRIAGDFNGWVPDKNVRSLVQAEGVERVWTKILRLPPGTYHYRYVVDGEWREDPDNPQAEPGPVGGRNSVLVVR